MCNTGLRFKTINNGCIEKSMHMIECSFPWMHMLLVSQVILPSALMSITPVLSITQKIATPLVPGPIFNLTLP